MSGPAEPDTSGRSSAPDELVRVALLGSYPTWPFRHELSLRRDTRHVTTTWNVNLAHALARRPRLDVHFVTLAAGIPATRTLQLGDRLWLHFVAMPRWRKGIDVIAGLRWSRRLIAKRLEEIRPDIVHGIGTEHPFAFIATSLPYPSVVTVHGVMGRVVRAVPVPWWSPKRFFARIERATLRKARHVITISPYVREALDLGPHTRTYDIENAIHPVFFERPDGVGIRAGVAFLGIVQPRKGLDVLLQALDRLPPGARPDPVLIIGPTVPEYAGYARQLRETVEAKGLSAVITWIDALGQEELRERLSAVKCLVLPSREETAPMVIAEALACGTPVIATDVGGVRHMVRDGITGSVVPPEDPEALATALHRIEEWDIRTASEAARAEAERRYHPDSIAAATEEVYRKVIGDGSGS